MLQAFIITLREGVEAALIIGITLAYLQKIGRPELRKTVFAALGTAIVGSVAAALALAHTSFKPELFEGTVMLLAAVMVVTMIVFMAKASRTLKKHIEQRVDRFADAGSRAGLFAFVFLMVLREGAETVLVLSAVSFNTSELLGFLGTLAGVALSVLFGVMFVRGSVRINLGKFFKVTTVILVFVAIQLTISGLHELSEGGYVPSSRRQMALIGPIVRNDIFFFVTMLALAALMVLFESRKAQPATVEPVGASRAEQRKTAWAARRDRSWTTSVYVSSFVFIMLVTAQFIYAKTTTSLSPATLVEFREGTAAIAAGDMKAGDLRRYAAEVRGKQVRFLLYKKPDGTIAVVLDACSICGPIGFFNNGAQGITCKNCNAPVNPQSVGEGGGCNPIPLAASVKDGTVTVRTSDLEHSAGEVRE